MVNEPTNPASRRVYPRLVNAPAQEATAAELAIVNEFDARVSELESKKKGRKASGVVQKADQPKTASVSTDPSGAPIAEVCLTTDILEVFSSMSKKAAENMTQMDDDSNSTEDGNAAAGGKFDDTFFAEIKSRREALLKKEGEQGEK